MLFKALLHTSNTFNICLYIESFLNKENTVLIQTTVLYLKK